MSDNLEELKEIGRSRSNNCLLWAGFSLTNFVTVVALYSVFNKSFSALFQVAIYFFLLAGGLFATAWGLYETVGSNYKIKIYKGTKWFHFFSTSKIRKNKLIDDPRPIYVRYAQSLNILGTLVWFIGVALLIFDLKLLVLGLLWLVTAGILWVWSIVRYHFWVEN